MLRVTPIYGSRNDSNNPGAAQTPSCTLVEYGGVRVLCNVGWDDRVPTDIFSSLPKHEVLILSDSTLGSMGALPLYCQSSQSTNNMYATFPTVKMGQMALYDYHACLSLDGGTPPYSLDEIDTACSSLRTIKYSQTITVNDPETNQPSLEITAHRAGHVVGGAFYVLKRLLDDTIVVLTGTYHVAKESHLDSATLLKHGATPDVLVTKPGGPTVPALAKLYSGPKPILPPPLVSQSHKALVETVLAVLRRDGHVLLPVDASGRVLELLYLLNTHWEKHRLASTYNLCWLGPMVTNVLEYARCQLEWMHPQLGKKFDSQRGHPFAFAGMHFCGSVAEFYSLQEETNNNPTVVLASGATLDCGPARDLLLRWADNPDHAVIMTDSSYCGLRRQERGAVAMAATATATTATTVTEQATTIPAAATTTTDTEAQQQQDDNEDSTAMVGSAIGPSEVSNYCTASQLLQKWCDAKSEGREMDDVVVVDVKVPQRAPLAGMALKLFQQEEEAARQAKIQKEQRQAMLREVELAKGRLRLGEEEEKQTILPKSSSKKTMMDARPRKKSRFDSSLFLKFSKPLHLTFEVVEEAVGIGQSDSIAKYGIGESVGRSGEVLEDDYGIAVIPERFVDIVTGVDPSKFAGGSGRIGEEVLRRGFGFGVDGRPVVAAVKAASTAQAAGRTEAEEGLDEEMDEQALEAADLSEGTGIVRGRNGRQPIKVTTVPRRLEVLAEVAYVPLEGRVDARSARQSVRALQPQQVVILGGTDDDDTTAESETFNEVTLLAEAVRSYMAAGDGEDAASRVFTPSNGETVELNVGHAAYSVRLLDTPYQTQEEKAAAAEDESLIPEPVEPYEAQLGQCTVSVLDCIATGQKVALDGSIVLAPRSIASQQNQPSSIYLSAGDVLLTDLRAEVIAQGMKAVYSAHAGYSQLVVNGKIIVKKDQETGKIDVEGPLCEDFFTVRSVVCGQYVTL